jgi:hypothetical protein
MAVILGDIHQAAESVYFTTSPLKWLGRKLVTAFSTTCHNPSPFPDRVWARHSALLDSARKLTLQNQVGQ